MGVTVQENRRKLDDFLSNWKGKKVVVAGVLEGATNHETGEPVAPYAAYNEFGTSRIPARPFMRSTLDSKRPEWLKGVSALLAKGRTPDEALRLLGMRMRDDIRATIKSNMPPPNSPATMRSKMKKVSGGAQGETMTPGTLIDTGSLINSIQWEIRDEPA